MTLYDRIGVGYRRYRRPDGRIQARLDAALEGASTVLNVGAGTGGYEPAAPRVVALEPSTVMLRQHPGALRARGIAEALPFPDGTFDAALAVMTVHHWANPLAGLAELRRVARRQVVFTFDAESLTGFWLVSGYFPFIAEDKAERGLSPATIAAALGAGAVEVVPVPHDCTDGFLTAYWRRPHQYLDPAVRRGISSFASRPDDVFTTGLSKLEADLSSGRWDQSHGGLLDLDEWDAGCRLITAST